MVNSMTDKKAPRLFALWHPVHEWAACASPFVEMPLAYAREADLWEDLAPRGTTAADYRARCLAEGWRLVEYLSVEEADQLVEDAKESWDNEPT